MLITNDFEVAQPVEAVWQFFGDIPRVASCLPGAELTETLGDDKYGGRVAVRMGPVRLQFAGTAEITERDEAAKRIVVHATGAEERGRGQASMVVSATLAAAGRGTKVAVSQDLQLAGAAAGVYAFDVKPRDIQSAVVRLNYRFDGPGFSSYR